MRTYPLISVLPAEAVTSFMRADMDKPRPTRKSGQFRISLLFLAGILGGADCWLAVFTTEDPFEDLADHAKIFCLDKALVIRSWNFSLLPSYCCKLPGSR